MRALCWFGEGDVRVEDVPEPIVVNARDAIIRLIASSISEPDLHAYSGHVNGMRSGDILGGEFVGRVVQSGPGLKNLKPDERVVVSQIVACGGCIPCQSGMTALCDNSNPNAELARSRLGYVPAGRFGASQLFGGYAGGQAEYVRIPYADTNCFVIGSDISDEQALFLAGSLPAGWQSVAHADIKPGDVVAVWGCGAIGQFAVQSAYLLGAEKVIAVDNDPIRTRIARDKGGAELLNPDEVDVVEALYNMTGGRGPDVCIYAAGENGKPAGIEKVAATVGLRKGVNMVLYQAVEACRKGGVVSIAADLMDGMSEVPLGTAYNKGLSFRMGPPNIHSLLGSLHERIKRGDIDPSAIVSHRMGLDMAPYGYQLAASGADACVEVVLTN